MNLSQVRLVLRPRGPLELLDLAFRCMLGSARGSYARLCVVLLVPCFLITVAAQRAGASWWLVWSLAIALGSMASGAFTTACGRLLFDAAPTLRIVLRSYTQRLPSHLGALLLLLGAMLLGSMLLIGGLVAWFFGMFIAEAVLLEQASAAQALSRSARLSRADSGRALAVRVCILVVCAALVVGTEELLLAVLEDVLSIPVKGDRLLDQGGSYFALAGYFCSVPWAATSRYLAYIDGRTRQDGWDLQVRLMAWAAETAP